MGSVTHGPQAAHLKEEGRPVFVLIFRLSSPRFATTSLHPSTTITVEIPSLGTYCTDTMAVAENKENVAPSTSSDPLQHKNSSPSPKKTGRKGRSKSIGPGGIDDAEAPKQEKQDGKNRRKSTYVPTTKSIISNDTEKAQRQAARRKTLANRRVSFAPEATLHTWDVIEFMRDQTTSTDSSDSTRRASNITRASNGGSPFKPTQVLDSDPPSTPPEQADEPKRLPSSPAPQRDLHQKKRRRSSGIPPMNFNNPEDAFSSDGVSGSSEISESEEDEDEDEDAPGSDDETGTAMSLDVDDTTVQSMGESESSTGSSARLEASLKAAAEAAGTRGIEYDEYGDESMEIAGEGITNAMKPWAQQRMVNEPMGWASMDQENVNPFSPAFKAQLVSGTVTRPATVEEENTGDLSMDITRAVGGIVKAPAAEPASSPLGDGTMDLTQAVSKIQHNIQDQSPPSRSGQKRRRSTTEAGSPGAAAPAGQSKRRRSSVARSSMGDDTMDLTMAVGGIQNGGSPAKVERRKSVVKRRSSGVVSDQDTVTMDLTQAVGGIKPAGRAEQTSSSIDENEELTMELTTVLGGIKAAQKAANDPRPVTPQNHSPPKSAVNTTPKDQERFRDAPDSGPKKLLTPIFQKQIPQSAEKPSSGAKSRKSTSPATRARPSVAFAEPAQPEADGNDDADSADEFQTSGTLKASPSKPAMSPQKLPSLGDHKSPLRATPKQSPACMRSSATPDSALRWQLDEQLQAAEPSPTAQKQERSSPAKVPATPEKPADEPTQDGRRLAESIKLMSTPRKETLKSLTPRKQTPAHQPSPQRAPTSRNRPTPKSRTSVQESPARQLSDDLKKIEESDKPVEKMELQKFLDLAGIRFMDLTTTKRRMTTAPTPSKTRKAGDIENEPEVTLEAATIAGSCTVPELEMYEHACHELKRYISDGKRVIKELETETAKQAPPLIQAYTAAGPSRKMALDAQMRDIKTHARYRSKEMWYGWRSQLLDDLMKALQGIGEGLIKDDEKLQHAEQILNRVMPGLVEHHQDLQAEAENLQQEAAATTEDEKEELEAARERLQAASYELREKQKVLEELQNEMKKQETLANDLEENRAEFAAAIKEADRVKEACRSVSTNEITALKGLFHIQAQVHDLRLTTCRIHPQPRTNLRLDHHLRLLLSTNRNHDLQIPAQALLPPSRIPARRQITAKRTDQPHLHRHPTTRHHSPLLPPTPPSLTTSTATKLNPRIRPHEPRKQRLGNRPLRLRS